MGGCPPDPPRSEKNVGGWGEVDWTFDWLDWIFAKKDGLSSVWGPEQNRNGHMNHTLLLISGQMMIIFPLLASVQIIDVTKILQSTVSKTVVLESKTAERRLTRLLENLKSSFQSRI